MYFNTILFILVICGSFYRFISLEDYLVSYKGDCDPDIEICYEYCEDNECFYYSIIERTASEVISLCGKDVTECDEAYECRNDVEECSIHFCKPKENEENVCVTNINKL